VYDPGVDLLGTIQTLEACAVDLAALKVGKSRRRPET